MKTERILGLVLLVAVAGAIVLLSRHGSGTIAHNTVDSASLTADQKAKQFEQYTEIVNPSGFLNTDGKPITIGQYVGKDVVLLDFLTYSCINCQRTFPYLTQWYDTYHDQGLEIIAIHTPEFAFEHVPANVQKALDGFGIHFPVVLDNDYATWNAYGNEYWPRKYLIDMDGYIVYDHIGEGDYDETEQKIVELLNERATRLNLPPVTLGDVSDTIASTLPATNISPETYVGTEHGNTPANSGSQCSDAGCTYEETSSIPTDHYELGGMWQRGDEYADLVSTSGSLAYTFHAKMVHLVASADTPVTAQVLLDGTPITDAEAGSDVHHGTVTISTSQLYNLVRLTDVEQHTLELRFQGAGAKVYTLTFG